MNSKLFKALRIPETLLMSGFFIIGSFFGIDNYANYYLINRILIIGLVTFFTILSIYSFNAFAGAKEDSVNKRLAGLSFYQSKVYLIFGTSFLLIALALSLFVGKFIYSIFTIIIFIIWMIYAYPKKGLKYKPYWGTVLHFVAQIIHFNICYYVVSSLDTYAICISMYFAVAFSIGHLNHEIIDAEADRKAKIKNTVTFKGVLFVLNLIYFLCVINVLYVVILYFYNIVNVYEFYILLFPAFGHLLLYIYFNKTIKEKAVIVRGFYRGLYFTCFLFFVFMRILHDVVL